MNWPFPIIIPTSNAYTHVCDMTLRLLDRFWTDRPMAHVVHYETLPRYRGYAVYHEVGPQSSHTWTTGLAAYVRQVRSDYLLLVLDDYGLFAPVNSDRVLSTYVSMVDDPDISYTHLTYQPVARHHATHLPNWDYSINLQAALWRTSELLWLLEVCPEANPWQFEHLASAIWHQRQDSRYVAEAPMNVPEFITPMADRMDKRDWVLPYHNLMHQGQLDPRHHPFLKEMGLIP